jgi:hypothetical protein
MKDMFVSAAAFSQTLCWDTLGKNPGNMFTGTNGGSADASGTGVCAPATDAPSASPSESQSESPTTSPSASPVATITVNPNWTCADASDCPPGSTCAMDDLNVRRRRMQTRGGAESRRRLFFDSSKREGLCTV